MEVWMNDYMSFTVVILPCVKIFIDLNNELGFLAEFILNFLEQIINAVCYTPAGWRSEIDIPEKAKTWKALQGRDRSRKE